mgnify:CR=1 FL=1
MPMERLAHLMQCFHECVIERCSVRAGKQALSVSDLCTTRSAKSLGSQ